MADEINRASPKTQSALLQAMQEHHVTVAGQRHDVPAPFHVLATQNPLEQEGTYPLPEAQLDRFLLQIDVSYPDQGAERRMLFATTGTDERRVEQILTGPGAAWRSSAWCASCPVPDKVVEAILKLARSARPGTGAGAETDRLIAWGPGPRASQALMLAVRAKALIDGRLAPSVDDVIALAEPVLKHRMALTFAARAEGRDRRAASSTGWQQRWSRCTGGGTRALRQRHGQGQRERLQARRRSAGARRPPARSAARGAARRQHGGARHPRPPARRARARPSGSSASSRRSDPRHRDRLAPLGQLRHTLRARARVGGGAHLLALARRVALHGLPAATWRRSTKRDRARGADAGRRRAAGARAASASPCSA